MTSRRRGQGRPIFEPLESRLLLDGAAGADFITLAFQGTSLTRLAYVACEDRTVLAPVGAVNFLVGDQAGSYGGLGGDILAASPKLTTTGYPFDVWRSAPGNGAFRFDLAALADEPALADPQRAEDLQRLVQNHAAEVVNADTAAAFGAAVWEIVHETQTHLVGGLVLPDYSLATGEFRLSPANGAAWDWTANDWLVHLGAAGAGARSLVSTGAQDFVWFVPPGLGAGPAFPGPQDYVARSTITVQMRTTGGQTVLVVLGTPQDDVITLSQSGSAVTVTTPQGSQDYAGVSAGVTLYGFGGADAIHLDHSLSAVAWVYAGDGADQVFDAAVGADVVWGDAGDDLLVSVGGGQDSLWGGTGTDGFWLDSLDTVADAETAETAAATVHTISQFAQPTSDPASRPSLEIAGQDLVDPTASYAYTSDFAGLPLWVNGPEYNDIAQGAVNDCYYLAGLAALAITDPARLRQSVTALGDGTYAVRFFDNAAAPHYYRVDGQLPTSGSQPAYAQLTPDGELWVAILEKAFAQYRIGDNTYLSLTSGWMSEPFRAVTGGSSRTYDPLSYTADALAQALAAELAAGHAAAAGTYSPTHAAYIVGNHVYGVQSVVLDGGVWYVTVYNPWGNDGAAFDSNYWDGLLTLTADQFRTAFLTIQACQA